MKTNATELNLDSTSADELQEFFVSFGYGTRPLAKARELFPSRPKGYLRAAKDLMNYAINKRVAMQLREAGKIAAAIGYEDICDRIYASLPDWAKGW